MLNHTTVDPLALEIKDLTFQYRRREQPAIHNLSFEMQPGEVMLVAGASGCGKTTLMRCINGLIQHTYHGTLSMEVNVFSRPVSEMSMAELSGYVGTLLLLLGSILLRYVVGMGTFWVPGWILPA